MSMFRVLLAWFLLAALPLQGAAGPMLACAKAAGSSAGQATSHRHAAHGHHHGHPAMAEPGQAAHAGASHGPGATGMDPLQAGLEQEAGVLSDDGHACPVCASCCSLLALWETPTLGLEPLAAAVQLPEGASRVLTRHTLIPDKPPRA